jgi:hypothetical protein
VNRIRTLALSALSVLTLSLLLAACGGGGGTSTPADTQPGSQNPKLAAARKAFCADLVAVGGGAEIRPEAIARLLPHLRHDTALYRLAGDRTDAARVRRFAAALARVRAAALGNGDPTAANAAAQHASAHLPSCTS